MEAYDPTVDRLGPSETGASKVTTKSMSVYGLDRLSDRSTCDIDRSLIFGFTIIGTQPAHATATLDDVPRKGKDRPVWKVGQGDALIAVSNPLTRWSRAVFTELSLHSGPRRPVGSQRLLCLEVAEWMNTWIRQRSRKRISSPKRYSGDCPCRPNLDRPARPTAPAEVKATMGPSLRDKNGLGANEAYSWSEGIANLKRDALPNPLSHPAHCPHHSRHVSSPFCRVVGRALGDPSRPSRRLARARPGRHRTRVAAMLKRPAPLQATSQVSGLMP